MVAIHEAAGRHAQAAATQDATLDPEDVDMAEDGEGEAGRRRQGMSPAAAAAAAGAAVVRDAAFRVLSDLALVFGSQAWKVGACWRVY